MAWELAGLTRPDGLTLSQELGEVIVMCFLLSSIDVQYLASQLSCIEIVRMGCVDNIGSCKTKVAYFYVQIGVD